MDNLDKEKKQKIFDLLAHWLNDVYPLIELRVKKKSTAADTISSVADFRKSMATPLERAHNIEAIHTITKHGKPYACIVGLISAEIITRTADLADEYCRILGVSQKERHQDFHDITIGMLTKTNIASRAKQALLKANPS